MLVHLLVLNFDGRRLLEECLPSVVDAARASRHPCDVTVVDNDSRDDSVAWLERHFPQVRIIRRPNRGLCSLNDVVAGLEGPVAILLNNDIKLDPHCVDPFIEPLLDAEEPGESKWFMTAPLCWLFDGATYEGFKTAVGWRWGLVQATALFPGHEPGIGTPGLTASAGAVLAVDCGKFVALGGFDPLFLPGRLEDLDLAFRAYQAGWHARYVPTAVAYHRGMATFGDVYGQSGCDRLALRNTFLFQWKNLRRPMHVARQLSGLAIRLAFDLARAPCVSSERRWALSRALLAALGRWRQMRASAYRAEGTIKREREFFRRFCARRLIRESAAAQLPQQGASKVERQAAERVQGSGFGGQDFEFNARPKIMNPGPRTLNPSESRNARLAADGTAANGPSTQNKSVVEDSR